MPSPPAEETIPVAPSYGDDNIRIVKIEKTNEPLVSDPRASLNFSGADFF